MENFKPEKPIPKGKKLQFEGVGNKDVYNITVPFSIGDDVYIAGRVESTSGTYDTSSVFFKKDGDVWRADETLPSFKLEDPFFTRINGEIVFGGVEAYPGEEGIGYHTLFYRGKDLKNLKKFAVGPDMMKDIRFVQLNDGIGIFTRPRGKIGGRGTIGFTKINLLDDLTEKKILNARLLKGQFKKDEWGGANGAYMLPDGRIGVIGHIAEKDGFGKHYRAMSFIFNPNTFESSEIKIIAERNDFPEGKAKTPELKDVVFPAGYVDGILYTGLSDAEAGALPVENPFN